MSCPVKMASERKVALVRSKTSIKAADLLPSNIGRASRVHALIDAFKLPESLSVIAPVPLTNSELENFHSKEFINCMFSADDASDNSSEDEEDDDAENQLADYGLLDDCYMFDGIEQHVRYAAGGTVSGARCLANGDASIAIHWEGGRHHCKRERASGFCYVNDIVLGILELNKTFSRVLYVDLDLHHGDGVQDAFLYSSKVMTLSFHHFDCGFYPNSGGIPVEGKGKGKGFSLNVPLMQGTADSSFLQAFEEVMKLVWLSFEPQAVVVQCGSDGLAGDPYKVFNLTTDAFAGAVKSVLEWDIPTLLLGGGGYSSVNCARCWTRLTAIACGQDIAVSADIPDHKFYTEYVPACSMAIDKRLVADENTPESIADTLNQIMLRPH